MQYLIQADSRAMPLSAPSGGFPLVYADPPYNLGYNETTLYKDQRKLEDYAKFTLHWVSEAVKLMANNSRLVVCTYAKNRYLHELIIRELDILTFEQEIIWFYNFGPYSRKRFVSSHENILVFKKGRPPFNWEAVAIQSERLRSGDPRGDIRGRTPGTVWEIPRNCGNYKERYFVGIKDEKSGIGVGSKRSQQPEELVRRIIKAFTNKHDWILDPFCGTGTVPVVCRGLERLCISLEISYQHILEARQRYNDAWKLNLLGHTGYMRLKKMLNGSTNPR